jgi:hypothetical protein
VTGTDAAGNTTTTTLTDNQDGSQQLQIATSDPAGNGTLETIQFDSTGAITGDDTITVDGGSDSSGDDDDDDDADGDDDGSDDDEEDDGPDS